MYTFDIIIEILLFRFYKFIINHSAFYQASVLGWLAFYAELFVGGLFGLFADSFSAVVNNTLLEIIP